MIILDINLCDNQVEDIALGNVINLETAANNNAIHVNMVEKGDKGDDGITPIKGIDYMTESDLKEITELIHYDAGIVAATVEEVKRLF